MKELYSSYLLGDMRLMYRSENGKMTMLLIPAGREADVIDKQACAGAPLVELHVIGDTYPAGFAQGRSMLGGETTQRMRFVSQCEERTDKTLTVKTLLADERGLQALHEVVYREGRRDLTVRTSIVNGCGHTLGLEMLSSFALGNLTPFCQGVGDLHLTRLLSCWSNEAQLLTQTAEELQIEPSWAMGSHNGVRFGQVGSMPVRGWAPIAAVTDAEAGVTWAARLTHASSWQMELSRKDNGLTISGGLADREFGHFLKNIAPGERFDAPEALLTVTTEGFDEVCFRMIDTPEQVTPETEKDLPAIFNEYCTTWGVPSAENIKKISAAIAGHGFRYFVIDAGWYATEGRNWSNSAGDWEISRHLFPDGLDAALMEIRKNGMVPGIWFELEVCSAGSDIFHNTSLLLHRDGYPLQVGERRFFDFTLPEVRARMKEKVIDFLNAHQIGYIKVDYNETIGIGADGAESQGEKLRRQVLAVQDFFDEMKKCVPGLVVECCASGGHRLVSSFLDRTDMVSFSDAHECPEIPVIAKNVLRIAEMRKSQIWCVIHKEQTLQQIVYKLTGGMLGRICISGDVLELTDEQWKSIDDGLRFHEGNRAYLTQAKTRFFGTPIVSARHPHGWQAVERIREEGTLIVANTFVDAPERIELDCAGEIEAVYTHPGVNVEKQGDKLVISGLTDFDGAAVRLKA